MFPRATFAAYDIDGLFYQPLEIILQHRLLIELKLSEPYNNGHLLR